METQFDSTNFLYTIIPIWFHVSLGEDIVRCLHIQN